MYLLNLDKWKLETDPDVLSIDKSYHLILWCFVIILVTTVKILEFQREYTR